MYLSWKQMLNISCLGAFKVLILKIIKTYGNLSRIDRQIIPS